MVLNFCVCLYTYVFNRLRCFPRTLTCAGVDHLRVGDQVIGKELNFGVAKRFLTVSVGPGGKQFGLDSDFPVLSSTFLTE